MNACSACKSAPANLYCAARKFFICEGCELKTKGHCHQVLAGMTCQLCEEQPAVCFCKNDDAYLCKACDEEMHKTNPLAARHERIPLQPAAAETSDSAKGEHGHEDTKHPEATLVPSVESIPLVESLPEVDAVKEKASEFKDFDKVFDVFDFDNGIFDMGFGIDGMEPFSNFSGRTPSDGVVPVFAGSNNDSISSTSDKGDEHQSSVSDSGFASLFDGPFDLPMQDSFASAMMPNLNQSSFMVPEQTYTPAPRYTRDPDNSRRMPIRTHKPMWASGYEVPTEVLHVGSEKPLCREERVARYREKRMRRTFEKTIRYESRKAYAEVRPRIKGRFATKEEVAAMKAEAALAAQLQQQQPLSNKRRRSGEFAASMAFAM